VSEGRLVGLPAVVGDRPQILILGSFPGVESLRRAQYYANPRNAFWPIMGELVGAGPELPYAQRLDRLRSAGVALWDVLAACRRPGSGDDAIEPGSEVPSDLVALVARHATIRLVGCNGQRSYDTARRDARLRLIRADLPIVRLPSTSPRNAREPARRLMRWREVLAPHLEPTASAASTG
jgi:TDG/mug DNA glycosylase family protein